MDNLGLDQLDLFLIHGPLPTLFIGNYAATWLAMNEFVTESRLRSAGMLSSRRPHLERIVDETGIIPAVSQFELHPYFANRDSCDASKPYGVAIEAHSPLGHNNAEPEDATMCALTSPGFGLDRRDAPTAVRSSQPLDGRPPGVALIGQF